MALLEGLFGRIDSAIDGVISTFTGRPADDEADPGRYPQAASDEMDSSRTNDGSIVVNGVPIPKLVADQLRQLGLSLSWYSKGQLEAAINGCSVDCNLVDDPEGINFFDDLRFDDRERAEAEGEVDIDPNRRHKLSIHGSVFTEPDEHKHSAFYDSSFRDRIRAERGRDRDQRKSLLHSTTEDPAEGVMHQMGA